MMTGVVRGRHQVTLTSDVKQMGVRGIYYSRGVVLAGAARAMEGGAHYN